MSVTNFNWFDNMAVGKRTNNNTENSNVHYIKFVLVPTAMLFKSLSSALYYSDAVKKASSFFK